MSDQAFPNDDWGQLRADMKAYRDLKSRPAPSTKKRGRLGREIINAHSHQAQVAEASNRVEASLHAVENSAFSQKDPPSFGPLPPAAIGPARRLIEHLRRVRADGGYQSEADILVGQELVDRFSASCASPRPTPGERRSMGDEVIETSAQDSDGDGKKKADHDEEMRDA